ncbi:hypothetical protein D3C74_336160 [compost metagenome]
MLSYDVCEKMVDSTAKNTLRIKPGMMPAKLEDTIGGTESGNLMVQPFSLMKLYTKPTISPTMMAENMPLPPRKPMEIE